MIRAENLGLSIEACFETGKRSSKPPFRKIKLVLSIFIEFLKQQLKNNEIILY